MESIERLRKYLDENVRKLPHTEWIANEPLEVRPSRIYGYIDEIEREVKELTDERDLLKTQWEAGVDFDQRLEACADKREDVTLFGVDYIALPEDADGVPIHVGDVLEWSDGETFRVEGIGGETLFYIGNNNECEWTSIDLKHHHHAPTVEDVLRELVAAYMDTPLDDSNDGEFFAEFAKRLRLAGGEDA